jgi:hypothetical protein
METDLSHTALRRENETFRDTGGRSEENRSFGFLPAFANSETQTVYPSRFANGAPAPFHLLDGLPAEVVVLRHASGRVARVKNSIISGFVLAGVFYTRTEAAAWVQDAPCPSLAA